MQVVEFKNVFHIKPDFGRFKDYQVERIKSICEVIEWSTNIITGGYIASPTTVGKTLLEKKRSLSPVVETREISLCQIFAIFDY